MLKWLVTLLDRLFAVAGALLFSQVPLFIQQYTQQLAGHAAELNIQIERIREVAHHTGKTLDQYIQKFLLSGDQDFRSQGELMQAMISRWHHLSEALTALQDSTIFSRPLAFMKDIDFDIIRSTFDIFQIGVPLSIEGAIYALIGTLSGFAIFFCIRQLFCILLGNLKSKKKELTPNVP